MNQPTITHTEFKAHFPVVVMQQDHDNVAGMNDALSQLILSMEHRFRDTDQNAAKQAHIATEGGYQTAGQLNFFDLKDSALNMFSSVLLKPAIDAYLRHVFEDAAAELTPYPYGWANILRAGDWQRPHNHASSGNLVSGVYYVRVPEEQPPSGCIDFLNPLVVSQHHGYSPCQRVQPQVGKLILFPPYHIHYVHPIVSQEPRIVIAFDVMAHSPGPQLVF